MTLLERESPQTAQAAPQVELRTPRLILRTPVPADAPAVAALIDDRRIAENTARIPFPYTLADAEQFIAYANTPDAVSFFVTLPDGAIVGGCGIPRVRGNEPEIGYWYGARYWGRGYATEAARALITHAFDALGYEVMNAGARVSNPASRNVLEKCGFVWTGVILQHSRALATSVPCDRFRLDRERWCALKAAAGPGHVA